MLQKILKKYRILLNIIFILLLMTFGLNAYVQSNMVYPILAALIASAYLLDTVKLVRKYFSQRKPVS